jgi:Holliday junction resolvase
MDGGAGSMSAHPPALTPDLDEATANRSTGDPTGRRSNRYASGTRFEHKTRDDLISNGYDVIRAAGSKGSTKVDLVAVKPGSLIFIQCKATGTLPPAEWDRLVEVAGWVGAAPVLAANGPRGHGIVYTQLLGPKRPRARTQPCEPFLLDEIATAA